MEMESFEEESDYSSISTCSFKSSRSTTIYSRSTARFVDHFEIFRNEPEIVRFCFYKEDTNKTTRDFRLEELGLNPYICGYLGRGKVGTANENRDTAYLKFLDKLEEKCHAQPSILDHGKIISIQYSDRCLTDTEMETRRSQVVELFKDADAVRSFKVSFPEKQNDIDIIKRKLNHHLKERNIVGYTFSDPERATEIGFAYEGDICDFLEKLANDIKQQRIITKSETFEDQQMQVLKVRHKWWKSVLVEIHIDDKTVQTRGLEEDVREVFFKIAKALISAVSNSIHLDDDEANIFQSNTAKKLVKKQTESLPGRHCLDWLIDENVIRIVGPNEGTVRRCAECIKECVKSKTICEVPDKVISSKAWRLQLENLHQSFKKKLVIRSIAETIIVTSTSDIHKNALIIVESFLKRYTPHSLTIQSDRPKLDFFERNHQATMEENFKDEFLQITRQSEREFRVDGTRQSIEEVRRLIDNIVIALSWVAQQNVIEFLQSNEGNQLLNKVSEKSVCVIHTGHPSILLRLIKGRIEEQKVDVIVNSAAPDLSLDKGEVAKCLSRAAGAELQQDILRQYHKGVPEGKVLKGKPGNLPCKSVYHVVLPMKITGKEAIKEVVRTLTEECLAMAIKDNYESLAFPVFGTGTLDYPPEEVANAMYDVIVNFALKNVVAAITVKEIMIVLLPGNARVITAFDAIQRKKSKRVDDCKKSRNKLLMEPCCLLEFYIVFASDSMQNNKEAVAQLEELLP